MRGKIKVNVEWQGFDGEAIILPICPRSPGVRRRNLSASLNALRTRVDRLKLVMCDTLDHHNLPGPDSQDKARKVGDEWLASNVSEILSAFPSFDPAKDLFRWDDVKRDPSFERRLDILTVMYRSSEAVRMVIGRISQIYLQKRDAYLKKYGLSFDHEREMRRCAAYLIEEFAGTAVYGDWFAGMPEAYWGVYVSDPQIFDHLNMIDRNVRLTLPRTLALHIASLDPPLAGERRPSAAA